MPRARALARSASSTPPRDGPCGPSRPHRGACAVRMSADRKTLLTYGMQVRPSEPTPVLAWWDVGTGKPLGRLQGDFPRLLSADLSHDHKVMAVALGHIDEPGRPAEVKLL